MQQISYALPRLKVNKLAHRLEGLAYYTQVDISITEEAADVRVIDQGAQIHNVLVITQQKQEKRTKCLFFHPGQLDMCGKASNDAKCSFMLKVRSW